MNNKKTVTIKRSNRNISLRGLIARGTINLLMKFPNIEVNSMLEVGSRFAKENSWDAPNGYTLSHYDISGLPLELLVKDNSDKKHVILQFHGGAYVIGFLDLYRNVALRYSKVSGGVNVASIDYRIAPKYQYPAALEDAQKAWNWLLE
ncbi:MAG: acetylhydrolase, partial [Clostridiales bacterium]|nr:acetylhydrolase [Clostridiales bacterium]